MRFQQANEKDFSAIQKFYWDVIDDIHRHNVHHENLGWEKGIYPSDDFLQSSIQNGELYVLTEAGTLYACVIVNSQWNEGYNDCPWSIACAPDEILVPHALAVSPSFQGQGIGKIVVESVIALAESRHRKAVRLDVLSACRPAERLYRKCGFRFVAERNMYYEDTGWTAYKMFERNL